MKIPFLLCFLAISIYANAQIIEGKFLDKSGFVEIFEPIGIGPGSSLLSIKIEADTSGYFKYKPLKGKTGYFRISFSGNSKFYFLTPADSVYFILNSQKKMITIKDKRYSDRFRYFDESNNFAHKYKEVSNYPGKEFLKRWNVLLENHEKQLLRKIDSLHRSNLINDYIYSKLSGEIRSQIYSSYIGKVNSIKRNLKNPGADLQNIKKRIYQKLDPTDTSSYHLSLGWMIYINYYVRDLAVSRQQQMSDTTWSLFPNTRSARFLKKEIQEAVFGHILPLLIRHSTESEEKIKAMCLYFMAKFPDSEYTAALMSSFKELESTDFTLPATFDSSYQIISGKDYSSLKELTNGYFKGKPVLLDLWASWCSPCIVEFSHKSWLKERLAERGIELLYISLDTRAYQKMWISAIEKYDLKGAHYRNDERDPLSKELKSKISPNGRVQIPQYILVDGNGEILAKELSRPSTGEKMLKVIDTYLSSRPTTSKMTNND